MDKQKSGKSATSKQPPPKTPPPKTPPPKTPPPKTPPPKTQPQTQAKEDSFRSNLAFSITPESTSDYESDEGPGEQRDISFDHEIADQRKAEDSSTSARRVRQMIKDYADCGEVTGMKKKVETSFWADEERRPILFQKLLRLCVDVEAVVKREARVLMLQSPANLYGDIHGNLRDLLRFEIKGWGRKLEDVNKKTYLFLGDYGDRGENSVEVVMFLFALKILAPKNVYLLRGNHELRMMGPHMEYATAFSLMGQCKQLFGIEKGMRLLEAIYRVYDCLPFAAVLDKKTFCAHGGIPASISKVEHLQRMPCPIADPRIEAPAVWQCLWNDPIDLEEEDPKELPAGQQMTGLDGEHEGFVPNTKRGTAYYFTRLAVDNFLSANNLHRIVRAHECVDDGYQFHFNNKVITIFSSSKYCGGTNKAICLFIEGAKMKINVME